jgi:hypothetical protein
MDSVIHGLISSLAAGASSTLDQVEDGSPRSTDPALLSVLEELVRREPIFHRPEFGTARDDFERMTMPDFWEVGASGRRYSREHVLDELERCHQQPVIEDLYAEDFRCQKLAENLYLLTYTLYQDKVRKTLRSTIWRQTQEGWKIVFHQGTVVVE